MPDDKILMLPRRLVMPTKLEVAIARLEEAESHLRTAQEAGNRIRQQRADYQRWLSRAQALNRIQTWALIIMGIALGILAGIK